MKKLRVLMVTLCVAVFLCGFSVTAYAGGGPEWEGLDPAEGTTTPEPTIEPGEGFTEEGNLVTRDLLYDEHTNKQFITVQTSGGSTFYIVIDYDKPTDEDAEQYETYFFSVVDEADLLALMDEEEAAKYREKEPEVTEPAETEKPQETEPAPEEQKTESEQKKASPLPMIMLLLFVIGAAGVGGYLYIKMKGVKPASKKNQPDPDADYHDEDEDALQLPEDDGDEDEEVDVNEDYEAESDDEPV